MNNISIPLISVIMPVYNAEKYVAEAIESILTQTYQNFEFIIIDDCSTDNSYQILQHYSKLDSRIRLFHNKINYKLPRALNFGISQAQGKYIARMDADDISLPERFAKQLEYMEANSSIGVLGTIYYKCNHDLTKLLSIAKLPLIPEDIKIHMELSGDVICHPSVLMRTELFSKFRYNTSILNIPEDYDLWLEMLQNGILFANLKDILLKYRVSETQITSQQAKAMQAWNKKVINESLIRLLGNSYNEKIYNQYIQLFNESNLIKFMSRCLYGKTIYNLLLLNNEKRKLYGQENFKKFLKRVLDLKILKLSIPTT